jgi:hypothetical protein
VVLQSIFRALEKSRHTVLVLMRAASRIAGLDLAPIHHNWNNNMLVDYLTSEKKHKKNGIYNIDYLVD